jgi:two-component system response regulator AtoC
MNQVLIIDDDPDFGAIVSSMLEIQGWGADVVRSGAIGLERASAKTFNAVLLDLFFERSSGLDILKEFRARFPALPVIIVTGNASLDTVTEALNSGALDYLPKPFGPKAILDILNRAVRIAHAQNENRTESEPSSRADSSMLIGRSPAMIELFKTMARVSQSDCTVLIAGESGSGKELVARAIHANSARRTKPFVAINCGAVADTLLESELFGHVRGAFTGAATSRPGLFESAAEGTVFLDEISETTPAFQVKLLRVLQERTFRPVGSAEERAVDIRVIAATNQPAEELRRSGAFRRDLLYRLSVVTIPVPRLSDRREDIPLLAHHFLQRIYCREGKPATIPPETMEWLQSRRWEGNVRELENAVERAVAMSAGGPLAIEDFAALDSAPRVEREPDRAVELARPAKSPPELDEVIRAHIVDVLRYTKGNKRRAADVLGIARWSLYRMAKRLAIDLDASGSERLEE